MTVGSVVWGAIAVLVALWFLAHVQRCDVTDYEIKTQNASLGTRASSETSLPDHNYFRKYKGRQSGNLCVEKGDKIEAQLGRCTTTKPNYTDLPWPILSAHEKQTWAVDNPADHFIPKNGICPIFNDPD